MSGQVLRVLVLVLTTVGLVTACGSSDRPSEISVGNVKACDLISPSALHQLQVEEDPQPADSVSGVDVKGTSCQYLPRTGSGVLLSVITNHGIDRWMDGTFEDAKFEEVSRIQGFRTIKVWSGTESPGRNDECTIYVDVADDQSLRVEVAQSVGKEDRPTCATARRFANAAMKTLTDN